MATDRILKVVALFAFIALFSGCASDRIALPKFNKQMQLGHYKQAIEVCNEEIDEEDLSKEPEEQVLWNLQKASVKTYTGECEEAVKRFDQCESGMNYYDNSERSSDAADILATFMLNDSYASYEGKEYDRIMVNTYKGLNFALMGDFANARVEFNRCMALQDSAKVRHAKKIEDLKKEQEKAIAEKSAENEKKEGEEGEEESVSLEESVKGATESDEVKKMLSEKYSNLDNFAPYPDFVNPFSTYFSGLFFLLEGDVKKSTGLLKEVYGMDKNNKIVQADFAMADSGKKPYNKVWVVFENGLCPVREEFRLDIPVFLFTQDVKYVGLALPKLEEREPAFKALKVTAGEQSVETVQVCDMDRVIKTEFKNDYPMIVTKEITRQIMKTYAQYIAQKELGDLGGIGMGLFQASTTAADIRSWTALPKNFQITSVEIPENREITLSALQMKQIVKVPSCDNAIVYVKIPSAAAKPVINIIKFGGKDAKTASVNTVK